VNWQTLIAFANSFFWADLFFFFGIVPSKLCFAFVLPEEELLHKGTCTSPSVQHLLPKVCCFALFSLVKPNASKGEQRRKGMVKNINQSVPTKYILSM